MKQKRYWLRGGLIFAIIALLSSIIIVDTTGRGIDILHLGKIEKVLSYPSILFYIPIIFLFSLLPNSLSNIFYERNIIFSDITFIGVVSSIIIWFIIGAIIGLFYGKFKNRSHS